MGTVTRSIVNWLALHRPDLPVLVLDTRSDGPGWRWPFRFIAALIQFLAFAVVHRPNLLHLQVSERSSFLRKGLLLFLGRLFGIGIILHHHGAELVSSYDHSSPLMQWWMRTVAQSANINIVLGQRWQEFAVNYLGVPPSRVRVLYNASPDIRGTKRARHAGFTYLLAANLSARKGVAEFLDALSEVRKSNPDVRAILAGGGDVQHYKAEAHRLNLASIVTFTGWVGREQMTGLFNEADCLVLPSYDEGLPMTILESLSAGTPVITTPVGSIPEVFVNEENCLFVPPGDSAALALAMQRIFGDVGLQDYLSQNGRLLYEKKFKFDSYIDTLQGLYKTAVSKSAM
jgi:glycosyltransferase involved in cell wall biosynthesis